MEDIFVIRQAIHNPHNEVIGYELLFNNGSMTHAYPNNDAEQSAQLIINTFMGIGLENIVGSSKAFINLSHDFFTNEHPIPMASYQLVLEVSGDCLLDDKVYQELKQLSKQGYTFSLYDYEYDETTAERLDCIDIVKININQYDTKELKEQTRYYRNHGKRIQMRGLESDSQQLLCSQLGIDYYQGDLLSPVERIQGTTTACNVEVLKAISNAPSDIESLLPIVSQDAVLCYKLLRYINCASFSERSEISSLKQALELIGADTLKHWATLVLVAQQKAPANCVYCDRSLQRAEKCRELADDEADKAFLTGLLSMLDEALETPLEDLLDSLALSIDISFALLFSEGRLGEILESAKQQEESDVGNPSAA